MLRLCIECEMTVPGHIRNYINIVTCTSALVCLALSIGYTQYTVIGQPLAEVRAALLSAPFLRHSLSGDLCEGFYFPGSLQLNLCLTPFQWKKPTTNNWLMHTTNREVEKRLWISRMVPSHSYGA